MVHALVAMIVSYRLPYSWKFSPKENFALFFCLLLPWMNFYPMNFLSCVNDYMDFMADLYHRDENFYSEILVVLGGFFVR